MRGPEDLNGLQDLEVLAAGYNDPMRRYVRELLLRPLTGVPIADDNMCAKIGLLPEAWEDTGRCVLYQLQQVLTGRSNGQRKERYTLGWLKVIFDEVWERPSELGPRLDLAEEFGQYQPRVAGKDLVYCITQDRPAGLRMAVNRFYGWPKSAEDKAERPSISSPRGLGTARTGASWG